MIIVVDDACKAGSLSREIYSRTSKRLTERNCNVAFVSLSAKVKTKMEVP